MNTDKLKKEDEACHGVAYTPEENERMRIIKIKSDNITLAAERDFHKSRAERFNEECILYFRDVVESDKKIKELNKTIQILVGAAVALSISLIVVFTYYQTI